MARLAAVRDGEGPLLVALHGFTQTHANLEPLLAALRGPRAVLAVDLPGHGASGDVTADLEGTAALVLELVGDEPFDLLGYSLGGRVALHVVCRRPPGLRRAVVVGAHPGLRDAAAREARLERDRALAAALREEGDVEAFLRRWLANPMFATLPAGLAGLEARAANHAEGLAASLEACSLGTQRDLREDLKDAGRGVLFLAGARDDPFVAEACRLAAGADALRAAVVPGAGHACHLERPGLTARLCESFLDAP